MCVVGNRSDFYNISYFYCNLQKVVRFDLSSTSTESSINFPVLPEQFHNFTVLMPLSNFSVLRLQLQRGAMQNKCLRAIVVNRNIHIHVVKNITSKYRFSNGNGVMFKRFLCAPPSPPKKDSEEGEPQPQSEEKAENTSDNLPIRRIEQEDDDYYDDFESSGSKNSWKRYVSYAFGISLLGLFGWAGYSLTVELFGRGASNNLFSETFEKVRYNDEILLMTGAPMKAYGQDSGRRSEGRRNHVANR